MGAGPAGMQAALTAAERGHKVTLAEASDHLGGNLIKAADVKVKAGFRKYIDWIIPRVEKSATVALNTTVDAAYVAKLAPDVLILAAGTRDVVPPIPGVDKPHVHLAWQADNGSVPVGSEVVIIGAGLVGTESGMQLAEEGKKVTIVEMLPPGPVAAAKGMLGAPADKRAKDAGVRFLFETCVDAIEDGKVILRDVKSGELSELKASTVLLAAGVCPRKEFVEELRHTIAEGDVYVVGDLRGDGGTIGKATNTAFEVAAHI
ncbi:MAG: NAD(P)/FAD-dependent oxidoreductase [Coriobacteriales bacterium]|nr:NAD(P)/FAD-dependent oxidoreductase [Coriobacteriales bacterium]